MATDNTDLATLLNSNTTQVYEFQFSKTNFPRDDKAPRVRAGVSLMAGSHLGGSKLSKLLIRCSVGPSRAEGSDVLFFLDRDFK